MWYSTYKIEALYSEDKNRIRKYLETPGSLEKMVGTLVEKLTVPVCAMKPVCPGLHL